MCVRVDVETGEAVAFCGPKYALAPDESCTVGFPLELMDVTQLGYGCSPAKLDAYKSLPPDASKPEGIWRTDLKTNTKNSSFRSRTPPPPPCTKEFTYYFWHCNFNR